MFGLVFVVVNAGDLPAPFDLAVRVLGVVAFVGVVGLLLRRGGRTPLPEAGPRAWKVYRVAVDECTSRKAARSTAVAR